MWVRIGNLGLRTKLLGAFGVILVITMLVSGLGYRAYLANEHAGEWVDHTQQLIGELHELASTTI